MSDDDFMTGKEIEEEYLDSDPDEDDDFRSLKGSDDESDESGSEENDEDEDLDAEKKKKKIRGIGDPETDSDSDPDENDEHSDDELKTRGYSLKFHDLDDDDSVRGGEADREQTGRRRFEALNSVMANTVRVGPETLRGSKSGPFSGFEILEGSLRKTKPIMTRFEYAKVIGERATCIEQGMTDLDPQVIDFCMKNKITSALDIAEIELEMVECPFPMIVLRKLRKTTFEAWGVRELELESSVRVRSFDAETTEKMRERHGEMIVSDMRELPNLMIMRHPMVQRPI